LTVARYYTPLGRSIQKPYVKGFEAYDHDLINRFKDGEMTSADSIKHINEKKYTTQDGNVLYGGGGITPDVFVSFDTSSIDKNVMKVLLTGTINRFVYLNFLKHQNEFNQFTSPQMFERKYVVDDNTLNSLKLYAQRDSIYLNLNNALEKALLQKQIKVLTAREIWNTEGFYEVNNTYDSTVKKALGIMRQGLKTDTSK
jgi:carboxyl-terminal processing protease